MKLFLVLGLVLILVGVAGLRSDACYYRTTIQLITTCDCILAGLVVLGILSEIVSVFIWAFS